MERFEGKRELPKKWKEYQIKSVSKQVIVFCPPSHHPQRQFFGFDFRRHTGSCNFRHEYQHITATHITPRFTPRRSTLFRYGGVIFAQAERLSDKPAKGCRISRQYQPGKKQNACCWRYDPRTTDTMRPRRLTAPVSMISAYCFPKSERRHTSRNEAASCMTEAKVSGFMRPETHNKAGKCVIRNESQCILRISVFVIDAVRSIGYKLL